MENPVLVLADYSSPINGKQNDCRSGNDVHRTVNTSTLLSNSDSDISPSISLETPRGARYQSNSLLKRLFPTFCCLQLFGLLPISIFPQCNNNRQWRKIVTILLHLYSMCLIGLNMFLFYHTIVVSDGFRNFFGVLHAQTISALINGMKPLINLIIFTIFMVSSSKHRAFLEMLDKTERHFVADFEENLISFRVNHQLTNLVIFVTIFLTFMTLSVIRVTEFVVLEEQLMNNWMIEFSFLIVPLLSIWNLLPLAYFVTCNRFVTDWSFKLQHSMRADKKLKKRGIRFYYDRFIMLTDVQESMADTFNPFILFSLTWTVFTLCLAIYFVTQSDYHFQRPDPEVIKAFGKYEAWYDNQVVFNMLYGCLQVVIAILTAICICFTGCFTNEETRKIFKIVLKNIPDEDPETIGERFYVSCFVYKLNSQSMWGASAWRAFPLERNVFFTLVSMVLTYSFLLIKFGQDGNKHKVANNTRISG